MEEEIPTPVPRKVDGDLPLDAEPDNLNRIRETDHDIGLPRERTNEVLVDVERLLVRHRKEEISSLLDTLRALLESKGPLAVAYDPATLTTNRRLAARRSFVAADSQTTLESLTGPIRRQILRRLAQGPCTFTETLKASRVEDTSKFAFHLRKLSESGLVEHTPKKKYRLTRRGEEAVAILYGIDRLDSAKKSGNQVLAEEGGESSPGPPP